MPQKFQRADAALLMNRQDVASDRFAPFQALPAIAGGEDGSCYAGEQLTHEEVTRDRDHSGNSVELCGRVGLRTKLFEFTTETRPERLAVLPKDAQWAFGERNSPLNNKRGLCRHHGREFRDEPLIHRCDSP
jgi:hypothetical protein